MLSYIVKRILVFIPTLLAVSLITFVISVNAPGDPVEQMLNKNGGGDGQASDKLATEKVYRETRQIYGLDLPLFYFDITNATCPDTLYKIADETTRNTLERLSNQYGHWDDAAVYYTKLRSLEFLLLRSKATGINADLLTQAKTNVESLYGLYKTEDILHAFQKLSSLTALATESESFSEAFRELKDAYLRMQLHGNGMNKYIPVLHWHGTNNQYHRWFSHFITGDFGISYQDKRPVSSLIKDAWPWTAGISLFSVFLAYLISIPLGVHSAVNKGALSERISTTFLFMLYSLPSFWVATLCVIFLCGGDWLNIFPGPGAEPIPHDASIGYTLVQTGWRLVLPLLCWTYGSLAFISRQMRGAVLNEINQDYIRTARAKGLSENKVIWKHALRNSLLPIITLFAGVFPLAISGSIVLEHIFNIPGMGELTYEALFSKNYPVIFAVLMITAFLTLFGNLVADILYVVADPRISYEENKR